MATPGQLVQTMAEALGVPAATVSQYDRVLAESGLRSKGGRGLSAARVTATDAANLLIAIMASPISGASIKEAAEICKLYGALRASEIARRNPSFQNFEVYGLRRLATFPEDHRLIDAIAILIKGANTEPLAIGVHPPDDPTDEPYIGADHLLSIRVDGPRPRAEIFADSGAGGDPKKWAWLWYLPAHKRHKREPKTSPMVPQDLHQRRQVTYRTIRLLASALER
jgi:hypothetical protein